MAGVGDVEEGVLGAVRLEGGADEHRQGVGPAGGRLVRGRRGVEGRRGREQRGELLPHLLERPGIGLPVVEEADRLPDPAEDALALPEARPEVHPAQVLHQDVHAHGAEAALGQQTVREGRQLDRGRIGVALFVADHADGADRDPVDVHPGPVVQVVELQRGDLGAAVALAGRDLDLAREAQQAALEAEILEGGRHRVHLGAAGEALGAAQGGDLLDRHVTGGQGCGLCVQAEPAQVLLVLGQLAVAGDHLAEGAELLRQRAVLRDRGVVVVAGGGGLEGTEMIGAGAQAEVRAAVGHVEVDAHAVLEHVRQLPGGIASAALVVLLAPVIEPAVPELHAHLRLGGQLLLRHRQHLERAGAEVHGRERPVDRAAGQPHAGRTVGGHQQLVDAAVQEAVAQVGEVGRVVAEAAVLVLHLHHHHVAAAAGLALGDHGDQLVEPGVDELQVGGVAVAQAQVAVGEDPAGEAAVLPFGADVRAGAHDRVEPLLGGEVEEASQIGEPLEGGDLAGGLVHVPGHVGLHRVAAHRDQAAQAVPPLCGVDAEVVERPGDHQVRLPAAQEAVGGGLEQGGHRRRSSQVKRLTPV